MTVERKTNNYMNNTPETTEATEAPYNPVRPGTVRTATPRDGKPVLIDKACDVSAFASTDATRFVLNGIHFGPLGVEACDGRAAIRVPYSNIGVSHFPEVKGVGDALPDCIVPCAAVKEQTSRADKNKGMLPVLSTVHVSGNGKITLATTDLETERPISVKPIDGQYPVLDQVWPSAKPVVSIALSPTLLKRICDYCEKNGLVAQKDADATVTLRFTDELSPMTWDCVLEESGRRAEGVLMPKRMK